MLVKKIKYLVLSDIHFGSNKNKTENIINNLNSFFLKYNAVLSGLDMIIIAGDIFDRLLSSSSTDNILATEWLTNLVYYCKKNNIILRLLEGTPSHDSRQANVLNVIIKKLKIDVDFKYIDNIYIETLPGFNLDILYIPDEIHHESERVLKDVKTLMDDKGIDKVDIAVMHGAFKYQIPVIELPSMHDEFEYLKLVRYYISIGHIHSMSIYKRILAQGSFDRLAHNEEEDKGAMLITLDPTGDNTYKFLVNDNACIFKSIVVNTEDVNELIDILMIELKKYPINSHIRLVIDKFNPIYKSLLEVYKRFKDYNFSNKHMKDSNEKKVTDNVLKYDPIVNISITSSNIKELINKELTLLNDNDELNVLANEELSNII